MSYTTIPANSANSAAASAPFVTTTASADLGNETNLGALTDGLLKIVVSGGVATISTAVAGTDFAADSTISRQTLGADAQDITFAVTDTDERLEIEGYGEALSASVTMQVNGGGTAVTNSAITQTNGGAPGNSTAFAFATYNGPVTFRIWLDIKNLGLHRTGHAFAVPKSTGSGTRDQYVTGLVWPDAVNNVTSVVLHSSVSGGFKSGFRVICRRRKFT